MSTSDGNRRTRVTNHPVRNAITIYEAPDIISGAISPDELGQLVDSWIGQKIDLQAPVVELRHKTLFDAIIQQGVDPDAYIDVLLSKGIAPDKPNRRGDRPVITAARTGNWPLALKLARNMDRGGLDSISSSRQDNLFMLAALTNQADVVLALADLGCRPNYECPTHGYNSLGYYLQNTESASPTMVKTLIECVAKQYQFSMPLEQVDAFVNKPDITGATSLIKLAQNAKILNQHNADGAISIIFRALQDAGANLDRSDKEGYTPALWATINRNRTLLELLAQNGADLDAPNSKGMTPLAHACENGDEELVDLLLSQGADPSLAPENAPHRHPIISAAANGHFGIARKLLRYEADPDVSNSSHDGHTPLIYAIKSGDIETVHDILAVGGNADAANDHGFTPLMYAAILFNENKEASRSIVEALLDAGANPFIENKKNETVFDLLSRLQITDGLGSLWEERNIAYLAEDSYDGDAERARDALSNYDFTLKQKFRSGPIENEFAMIDYMRQQKEIDAEALDEQIRNDVSEGRRLLAAQFFQVAMVGTVAALATSATGASLPIALAQGFGIETSTVVGGSVAAAVGIGNFLVQISREDREKMRLACADFAVHVQTRIIWPAKKLFASTTLVIEDGGRAFLNATISFWTKVKQSVEKLAGILENFDVKAGPGVAPTESVVDLSIEDVKRVLYGMNMDRMHATETKIEFFRREALEHGLETRMTDSDLAALMSAAQKASAVQALLPADLPTRSGSVQPFKPNQNAMRRLARPELDASNSRREIDDESYTP